MKKLFTKLMLVLTLIGTGFTMTSCENENVMKGLEQLLNIWMQLNQGKELYFEGSSKVQHCQSKDGGETYYYNPGTGETSFKSHGLNMVVKASQAAIALGDFTVEGCELSNITFPAVTYSNGNIGDVKDEGYVYGVELVLTRDGKTTTLKTPATVTEDTYPIAFVDGNVTNEGKLTLNMQIHISATEYFDVVYDGNAESVEQ